MTRKFLSLLATAAVSCVSLVGISISVGVPAATAASAATRSAGTFRITGAGFGHGIGMSQYGAMGFAEHGWSYQQILSHYYAGTELARTGNPTVTVLLKDGAAVFRGATSADGTKLSASTTYGVVPSGSRLEIISQGRKVGVFRAPLTVTGPSLDVPNQGAYAGSLEFYPAGSGVLTVNAVDLEDYVKGVIAEEMPASWPQPALEAQAVAARTYVLASQPVSPDYDVYDNTSSQVYGGISGETSESNLAEANTRGQVVEDLGHVIPTYFFSSSGGHTESIQDVWIGSSPESYLVGESDPYDDSGNNPYYRWNDNISLATASSRLAGLFRGTLEGVKVLQHGTSPRIVSARVVGTQGSSTVSGETLQEDLGTMSTWMAFTTVTARGSVSSGSGNASASSSSSSTQASSGTSTSGGAGVDLVRAPRLTVGGTVFGGARGQRVTIQRLSAGRWVAVGSTPVRAGGAYRLAVSSVGVYRAIYAGAAAPAIRLG